MGGVELSDGAALRRRASSLAPPVAKRSSESSTQALRLALAGGGTGGHVLPGVHLVEQAQGEQGLADLLWFQTGRAVEVVILLLASYLVLDLLISALMNGLNQLVQIRER